MVKVLPTIVHTEGNCLYEEPCIYYLSLQVGEVGALDFLQAFQHVEQLDHKMCLLCTLSGKRHGDHPAERQSLL